MDDGRQSRPEPRRRSGPARYSDTVPRPRLWIILQLELIFVSLQLLQALRPVSVSDACTPKHPAAKYCPGFRSVQALELECSVC
jgi:hypothetical protein